MNYASFLFLICLIRSIRALKSLLILTITTKPKTKKTYWQVLKITSKREKTSFGLKNSYLFD